ncbi:putative hAT-like transposase, RNase-H [Lupinus albus]|uniref:Putative hAT-like transposase, RNase-H n=1 Tax=Lupinus albus TaxID=3870 RepID=A0A6A4PNC6_LUPAL|nr:putative hAT-like transposase, RNase-H [Lupinus albus]
MGVAIVLDARYKIALLEFYFDKLYDNDACTQVRKIRELCYDLMSDYIQGKISSENSFFFLNRIGTNDESLDEYDLFIERRRETRSSSFKNVLDHYSEEDVIKMTLNFDI